MSAREKRDRIFRMRLSDAEYAELLRCARLAGMSVAKYLRMRGLAGDGARPQSLSLRDAGQIRRLA